MAPLHPKDLAVLDKIIDEMPMPSRDDDEFNKELSLRRIRIALTGSAFTTSQQERGCGQAESDVAR